jgi:hypothetical protein
MMQFDHEQCGDTRERLYVTQTDSGWIFHCHNCAPTMSGYYKDKMKRLPSPEKTIVSLQDIRNPQLKVVDKIHLPIDYQTQLTPAGALWLLKYGITDKERLLYHIGFSPKLNRVILPIYNEDKDLAFWQGRLLETPSKTLPKYMSVQVKGAEKIFEIEKEGDTVVIVEDMVSAIKVGRHAASIALLGSYIPHGLFKRLKKYKNVMMWLDADKYMESVKYSKRFREFGFKVITVNTVLDPKAVNDDVIKEYLTNF